MVYWTSDAPICYSPHVSFHWTNEHRKRLPLIVQSKSVPLQFRRLCIDWQVNTSSNLLNVTDIFENTIQYGFGRSGGAERALHQITQTFEALGPDATIISTDMKNAFNNRSRTEIGHAL